MNLENTDTPVETPAPDPASPRPGTSALSLLLAVVGLGLLVFVSWQWWETRQQLAGVREEVGRRLLAAEQTAQREQRTDESLLDENRKLATRLDDIEQRLGETRDQEAALQALYQDVARGREEIEILEVEQAVTLAVQQLQLAGNVPAALLALRSADANLARLDKAKHLPLRKALAADIAVLMALPLVDVPGISLRIEQLVQGIDKLPLKVYGRPLEASKNAPAQPSLQQDSQQARVEEKKVEEKVEPPVAEAAAANGAAAEPSPELEGEKLTLDSALAGLREFAGLAWAEIRSMIRIQRFDRAEPALLAPGQEFFLRENLKLRLLSARLALFSRDQWTYRNELSTAKHWLENYFLDDVPAVSAAASQLDELLASEIVIDLPDLRASQQALLGLRDGRSAR